jgi:hypothetical protein
MRTCHGLLILPLLMVLIGRQDAWSDGIIEASKRGDLFAIRHYLKKSPDSLDAKDGFGFTPLDWAATREEWDAFELLIEAGARHDNVGFDGGTVLHRAAHHDRPDMVRLLLDRGADLSIQNQWGRTALHVAARRGCDLVAALLLSRGADPNAVTREGWTPLHVAYKAGQPRVVELLLESGADPTRRDNEGKVPADYEFLRPDPIELETTKLQEYVGRYALSPEVNVKVWMENGRLHMAEFSPDEIYPIGKDTFYCAREPWKVTFLRNDAGTVDRIAIDFLRRKVHRKRLPEYTYVGSKVCGECHLGRETGGQYVHWMQTAHARAYWELKTDWAKFLASIREEYSDIEEPVHEWRCLKCHVTGAQDFEGTFAEGFRQEEGVGCEACHGPGSAYIDPIVMADRDRFLEDGGRVPNEKTCRGCHEDDRFRFDERLPKITHPRPEAPTGNN